jgi:glycosyltransferase involved in cell wall biosynthesis
VFVIPSRQDNLPNTGLEAHACGTPVVAFATGGLVDIIDPEITGSLAEPFDPISLAAAIRWVLEDPQPPLPGKMTPLPLVRRPSPT